MGLLNPFPNPTNVSSPGKNPKALKPNALLTLPDSVSLTPLNAIKGGLCVIKLGNTLDTSLTPIARFPVYVYP